MAEAMSVSSGRWSVGYSSSEDSEDDGRSTGGGRLGQQRRAPCAKRRKTREDDSVLRINPTVSVSSDDWSGDGVTGTLAVPAVIRGMLEDDGIEDEDVIKNDGRARSFPHIAGNWATYVFAPFQTNSSFGSLVTHLTDKLNTCFVHSDSHMQVDTLTPVMHLIPAKELHISVSQTVIVRHHWIQPLVNSLRKQLQSKSSFVCAFEGPRFYCNDEKTRSFLGLRVSVGRRELINIVESVNSAFDEFALAHFYKDMDFHLSIAWWLGNMLPHVTDDMQHQLQESFEDFVSSRQLSFEVHELHCKTGLPYKIIGWQ